MAVLPIITAPDPRLKVKCEPVAKVDASIAKLMDDMLDTMYLAPGVGLAAPQVGVTKCVLVVDVSSKDGPREPLRMANPEIVWRSDELALYEEGCLSLPDQYADVERPARIRVRYLDEKNVPQEREAEGLLAICIQHEMDHLEGIIFVDHLSALKRRMILRKLAKLKKQQALASD
jgi:peptide deformylase